MGTLMIVRKKELKNYYKPFDVFVDGNRVGDIYEGSKLPLPIAQGTHEVYLKFKNERTEVLQVEIGIDEEVTLLVRHKGFFLTNFKSRIELIRLEGISSRETKSYAQRVQLEALVAQNKKAPFYWTLIKAGVRGFAPLVAAAHIVYNLVVYEAVFGVRLIVNAMMLGAFLGLAWALVTGFIVWRIMKASYTHSDH